MRICVFICTVSLLFSQCTIDRQINEINSEELITLNSFTSLDPLHTVQISGPHEPGEKLWLCISLISKESKNPLVNQSIHFYHTSSEGIYEPNDPNDESSSRLNALGLTNEEGMVFMQTILPGDYGNSKDNRHIHTTVQNARPEAYDIHFKQYTGTMGRRFISKSDQHFLVDLKRNREGVLIGFLTLEIKNPKIQAL